MCIDLQMSTRQMMEYLCGHDYYTGTLCVGGFCACVSQFLYMCVASECVHPNWALVLLDAVI